MLRLTIDARLQRAARAGGARRDRARAPGRPRGRRVGRRRRAWTSRTGAVKALVSYPGFNQVAAAGSPSYYSRLLSPSNPTKPLFNRATQGLYPAGSTFKPIVAEAALASGLISPYTALQCTPSLTVGGVVFHNVDGGINASMSLPEALQISCDTWFYRLGELFYARQLATRRRSTCSAGRTRSGLGHRTGLDLPGEAGGDRADARRG